MPDVRRGTVLSFSATDWTALVMLDGSDAESQIPVGQWVPATQLTAGSECAVLIFGGTNTDDGIVLGAYGAVGTSDTQTYSALNIGAATGATAGQVRIGVTNALDGTVIESGGAGYQAIAVRSTDASGVRAILAADAALEVRLGSVSNHNVHLYVNNAASVIFSPLGVVNLNNANGALAVNNTVVVGSRKTGWTAATNTKTRTTFDTTTVTLAVLAAHVGALIDDLISHGLIGT